MRPSKPKIKVVGAAIPFASPVTSIGSGDGANVPVGDAPVGSVVGCDTPSGQCQWSSCATHSPSPPNDVGDAPPGDVVGSGTPSGQCQ